MCRLLTIGCLSFLVVIPSSVFGQTSGTTAQKTTAQKARGAKPTWTLPRLPDGRPDFQGIWNFATATPLQRPGALGEKEVLGDAELEELAEQAKKNVAARNDPYAATQSACGAADAVGCHDAVWIETSTRYTGRTSLIVDPPDGRIPELTPAAKRLRDARLAKAEAQERAGIFDSWEDLLPLTRCVSRPLPRMTTPYNTAAQIVQAPGYVVIFYEFFHDARVIPTDVRPHIPGSIRQWDGDSRGHWEGDTLVVETTNFTDEQDFLGLPQGGMRMVERFTRIDAETLEYKVTIENPRVWTKPWTFVVPWHNDPDYVIFEYACHEGNIQMANILRGSRVKEKEISKTGGDR
jgi:hypothetical protein